MNLKLECIQQIFLVLYPGLMLKSTRYPGYKDILLELLHLQRCIYSFFFFHVLFVVVVIGFPSGAILNATEGITTTVNVCPQLLEGTLERHVSVFATTLDISARGEYHV